MGPDFQIEDDGLMATSPRSGDAIRLGDRLMVDVSDVAILRRTVYARRVRGEGRSDDARKHRHENGRSRRFGQEKPQRGGRKERVFGGKKNDKGKKSSGGGRKGKKSFGGNRKGKRR
jgi:ribonuclease R